MLMTGKYDVAAYIWPAYTGDEPRTRIFWPQGMGEWESVRSATRKLEGHSWPRKPLWGYQNEADPYVMEGQIAAAADHGVNVFIYDWYWYDRRPFLENCLNDGYLRARNSSRVKFYLMWANHDANYTWDKRNSHSPDTVVWSGAVDRREFETIGHRITERYFAHPNYYRIEGKPVFMIYDLANLMRGLGGAEATKDAFDWLRARAVNAGLPGIHLQLTVWRETSFSLSGVDGGRTVATAEITELLGFDSMTHYQFCHFADMDRDYGEILEDVEKEWRRLDKGFAIPYFPHISVGWDNNPRFAGFRPGVVKGNTPEAVAKGLAMAKAYADAHPGQAPLVTINSWNEWTETSYLQPDDLNGYGYLEAVRSVFGASPER
jgi:hypothetical protein